MKKEQDIPQGYTRITEVLRPFSNFDKIDPAVLANAAERGTRVHAYCESHALGLFVEDITDDCKNYVHAFKEWFDEMVVELVYTEKRLNSDKYKISGAFDLLVKLKGDEGFSIIDLKTPATPSVSWKLQTAAYAQLIKDELGIEAERRICLLLPKIGKDARVVEYTDHYNDTIMFFKALDLYRFFNV